MISHFGFLIALLFRMPSDEELVFPGVYLSRNAARGIATAALSTHGFLKGKRDAQGAFHIVGFGDGQHAPPVGIFRIHRAPGLQPDEEDARLLASLFPGGPALLLLVKRLSDVESVGAFFRSENGVIPEPSTSSREFPLPLPGASAPSGSGRWLIPSAIAAGMGAALLMHCTASQSGENPINSYSDTRSAKPGSASAASSATGKLWPYRAAKAAQQSR